MAKLSKMPHTFVIIGCLILLCGIATWFVPAGEFKYETKDINGVQREVIVNGSYHKVEQSPQTWQIFGSLLEGFKKQSGIIAFVLIIGGAFQILTAVAQLILEFYLFLKNPANLRKNGFSEKLGSTIWLLLGQCSCLVFSEPFLG